MAPEPPRSWEARYPAGKAEMLRYAAATGDFYPLHYDAESPEARAMGGAVVPGRYRYGCVVRCLLEGLPGARLISLECSYEGLVFVGEPLHVLARVIEQDGDRVVVRVATRNADRRITLRGRAVLAVLALPPGERT